MPYYTMMYHLILSSRGASAPERLLDELHRFLASNRECQKMRRQKIGGSGVGGGVLGVYRFGVLTSCSGCCLESSVWVHGC